MARCEHCNGSGLSDKHGPDDDELLSRVVLSAITISGQQDEIVALTARAEAAERLLDDIYPTISGRVIQLQAAGEEKAAAQWNEIAKRIGRTRGYWPAAGADEQSVTETPHG